MTVDRLYWNDCFQYIVLPLEVLNLFCDSFKEQNLIHNI